MTAIAFYAPMKPPDDPVPSGDRTMARALVTALGGSGLGDVRIASRLRSRDGKGDQSTQDGILEAAKREIDRLSRETPPDLWLTYHSYYKAPDLLGPRLARQWGIPYAIVEGTRASSRLKGPYARFAQAAEAACDAADVLFYLTDYDREALVRDRVSGQRIERLRPFLAQEALNEAQNRSATTAAVRLVACGMFRPGDKLASYKALASALGFVRTQAWSLAIVGDGPVRTEVETLFAPFGERSRFLGALDPAGVARQFAESDLLVWPGVGEAFGMVYLEAQAQGCPVLAEDRVGVRDVVGDGGWLVPSENPSAYAAAIDRLLADRALLLDAGDAARRRIAADHLLGSARRTLYDALAPLMAGARR